MNTDQYLTVSQAATESGQSAVTLRRHIHKGSLKVERWGPHKRIRIHRADLEAYLRPENRHDH